MPQKRIHKRYGALGIAATIAIIVAFLLAAQSTVNRRTSFNDTLHIQRHNDYVICSRVNKINRIIQKQVLKSEAETPNIEYYKTHKADLARVMQSLREEYNAFAPGKCPPKD